MGRRLLAWVLVTPVAAGGVLGAHAIAYALTATDPGSVHDYLAHAPQVVGVLATLGLVGLAFQQRSLRRAHAWSFALLAPLGFVCQEHVERLAHTGEVPVLLTSPSFLLGLVLQVPVAILCIAVARRVAGVLTAMRRVRRGTPGGAWLPLSATPSSRPRRVRLPRAVGRAPPAHLVS